MDLRNPENWISHLLESLPDEKLASSLKDGHADWEYVDGEMLKLGSLAHSQLDIPEIQRRGLILLASESKDLRLLAHLLRTLQHGGDPLLALRLLTLYVENYWTLAAPQNATHKQRLAAQVLKRFESGISDFAQKASALQRDSLLAELAKLAQRWQENSIPALAQTVDDLSSQYRRAFRESSPAQSDAGPFADSVPVAAVARVPVSQPAPSTVASPSVDIDSHDEKAWRDTLLKVAAILCERQPDSPQGYRLRRHALWQAITAAPQAESDGRTPLASFPADLMADYQARLHNADLALWQQVEKSLLLAPYWFDGHRLSAQIAQRLNYIDAAEAIRDEVARFLLRVPQLAPLRFNDGTPFMEDQTKQWLAASAGKQPAPAIGNNEDTEAARQYFDEQGLEAALRYLEALPEGEPRNQFHRQYLGAQLMEEAGMKQLAQQQYRILFTAGLRITLADWEPSLLEQLKTKFKAEQ